MSSERSLVGDLRQLLLAERFASLAKALAELYSELHKFHSHYYADIWDYPTRVPPDVVHALVAVWMVTPDSYAALRQPRGAPAKHFERALVKFLGNEWLQDGHGRPTAWPRRSFLPDGSAVKEWRGDALEFVVARTGEICGRLGIKPPRREVLGRLIQELFPSTVRNPASASSVDHPVDSKHGEASQGTASHLSCRSALEKIAQTSLQK